MRWSVGTKIASGYGIAIIIMAFIGVSSYLSTNRLIEAAELRAQTYVVLNHLEGITSDMKDAETGQRGFLLTFKDEYLAPYSTAQERTVQKMSDLRQLTKDNPQPLETLQALIDTKFSELAQTIQARRSGESGFKQALDIVLAGRGKTTMDSIRDLVRKMEDSETALLNKRDEESRRVAETAQSTIVYGVPLALVFLTVVGWLIVRNIAEPLMRMTEAAMLISAGELAVSLPAKDRSDEVGLLAKSFARMIQWLQGMSSVAARIAEGDLRVNVKPQSDKDVLGNAFALMVENLQRLTMDLTDGVNVLGSAAKEIAASSTQFAAGSAETASAVTETTTTVEEVRQTSQVASQKARFVADAAQKMTATSMAGKKSTEETSLGMMRIREQMTSVAQSMVRLSEQGQAIGQIIATVDDLAQQSNLLAVNASIEAAKAGEHGKGFAVVAQEVKSLAEQSKQATAQVRAILNEVQKATNGAVMATDQGAKVVEGGVKQSAEAGESIVQLSNNVAEAAQAAQQIAASSQQQLVGMDQVVVAIGTIKQATIQNVESAKQLESAARNLSDLGQRLKDLVGKYKLDVGRKS